MPKKDFNQGGEDLAVAERFIGEGRRRDAEKANTARLTVDLDKSLHRRFRLQAMLHDTTMSARTRDLVAAWTAEAEGRQP